MRNKKNKQTKTRTGRRVTAVRLPTDEEEEENEKTKKRKKKKIGRK